MFYSNLARKTIATICLFILFSQQVIAQSETGDDEWNHSLAVYLWGANLGGTTGRGSEVDVSFSDLLNNLELAAMASYQARKGKWSFLTDVIYMDLAGEQQLDLVPPIGGDLINVTTDASLDLKSWVIHVGGGYNIHRSEQNTLDFIFGARYFDLSTDLLFNFNPGGRGPGITLPVSASGDVWDGIVGLKGSVNLSKRWFVPYYADIGTGDSDLTWQAMAGISYRAAQWADIALTYRHLEWDLGSQLVDDLSFSGPMLGVIFRF